MQGKENFKIQEAMSVVDLISLNSQGDSIVSLLSTLWDEDCKLRKSCLSNAGVQSVTVQHVRWNLRRLTFRHRASCILGQAFHYSPENAFYIFNQQIYFII